MKYVTEGLAEALYEARKKGLLESNDYDDVDDRESEADNLGEVEDELDLEEARWVTMHGNHALVDDDGGVLKGGDPKVRKKVSKKEIEAAVKDANAKSKSDRNSTK